MKLRILSDLHFAINHDYPLELKDNNVFTLIAGDMGPDWRFNIEWIRKNVKKGAFVSGNHDAYVHDRTPLEDIKEAYHKEFPLDSPVTYFDDFVGVVSKPLDKKTLLVADVLYTDYTLPICPEDRKVTKKRLVEMNMRRASPKMSGSYMNDFCFYTRDGKYDKLPFEPGDLPKEVFYLRPDNYLEHFNKAFEKITKIVEDNPKKDIILMTHHCLSRKCIARRFEGSELNASYVSPKDAWIRKHPNIKLIVSGHVHHRNSFHVGKTLYVLNPLGYCKHGEHITVGKNGKKTFWTPDCFVDTKDWTVTYKPWSNPQWDETYQKHNDLLMKYACCFM